MEADMILRSLSEWAAPDDQFTFADVQAAWNYCIGQRIDVQNVSYVFMKA